LTLGSYEFYLDEGGVTKERVKLFNPIKNNQIYDYKKENVSKIKEKLFINH